MDADALSTEDLACPICMERLRDPFVTPCGHSFCYTCITTHLHNKSVCPCCSEYLTPDKVFPNFLLSKVVAKAAKAEHTRKGTLVEQLQAAVKSDEQTLPLSDVELLLETLQTKKQEMQQRETENNLELLLHFLNHSRESKTRKLQELQEELQILNKDIFQVETRQGSLPPYADAFLALPGSCGQLGPDADASPANSDGMPSGSRKPANGAGFAAAHMTASRQGRLQSHQQSVHTGLQHTQQSAGPEGAAGVSGRQTEGAPSGVSLEPVPSLGRLPFPSRPLLTSSLFRSNGQHLSTSALALDSLAANGACGPPAPLITEEPAPSEQQPASSSLPSSSDPAPALSSEASLPPASSSHPATPGMLPPLSSSRHRQPGLAPPHTPPLPPISGAPASMHMPLPSAPHRQLPPADRRPAVRVAGGHEGHGVLPPGQQPNGSFSPEAAQQRVGQSEPSSGLTSGTATTSITRSTSGAPDTDNPHSKARKRRFESQFEDLQHHYLRMRHKQLVDSKRPKLEGAATRRLEAASGGSELVGDGVKADLDGSGAAEQGGNGPDANGSGLRSEGTEAAVGPIDTGDLQEFSRMLSMFTHHSRLKVLASLPGASQRTSAAILSSIAFDRDARLFGTAGVSKRISIFNYHAVLSACANSRDRQAAVTPAAELVSRSKLSCLSWNCHLEPQLISSDYEGVITLWDTQAGQLVSEYEAHEKRIWSIDFCPNDAHLLVSGSDDGTVKVWSTSQVSSVAEIDMKANVCSVKYSPVNTHEIAIGSADHNVHLFDLRNTARPVYVFSGHRKAVSYVRYMGGTQIVSASTDSTLRLWNTQSCEPMRVYTGHVNEKNFVGLGIDEDFIACGSEMSEVFVYFRSMSKPIAKRLFSPPISMMPSTSGSGPSRPNLQFISAVCWKPMSQTLLAANSQGAIKVLQLTS